MFWIKSKKNRYTSDCKPQFYHMKVGFKGVCITRICFPDEHNFLADPCTYKTLYNIIKLQQASRGHKLDPGSQGPIPGHAAETGGRERLVESCLQV